MRRDRKGGTSNLSREGCSIGSETWDSVCLTMWSPPEKRDYRRDVLSVGLCLRLTGLCLCRTLLAEYRAPGWNWRRKCCDPWSRWRADRTNVSRASKYRDTDPRLELWPPDSFRRVLRPPFQFYPYYTENPFKNRFPFLNPRPYNLRRVDPLASEGLRRRNIFGSTKRKSKVARKKVELSECLSLEDMKKVGVCDVGLDDSCMRLSKNRTMVISPSILIGHMNDSGPDHDWILSNKPVNIYVDRLPDDGKVFKIVKSADSDVVSSSTYKSEDRKHKYVNGRRSHLRHSGEEHVVRDTCITTSTCLGQSLYTHNSTQTSEETWTTGSCEPCNGSDRLTCTEKWRLMTHPVKKKILHTCLPYEYSVDVGELLPDNENCSLFYSRKRSDPNDTSVKKHRREAFKRSQKASDRQTFQRFYYFPKLRRFSKRSCLEHRQGKRTTLSSDQEALSDYLGEPEYVNYYEYQVDDDDTYPDDDYRRNVFLNDYSYVDRTLATTVVNKKNALANYSFNSDKIPTKSNEQSTLPVLCKKSKHTAKDLVETNCSDSEMRVPVVKYTAVLPTVLPNPAHDDDQSLREPDDEEKTGEFDPVEDLKKQSPLKRFRQDFILKNLTDELEKRMAVLDDLSLDRLGEKIKKNTNGKTVLAENLSETTCPVPSTTSQALETTVIKPVYKFGIGYEEELPLLDSMFVSPNKALCERINSCRCVCSPGGMIDFFAGELQKGEDAKVVLKKLITYSCEVYTPITMEYQIASDMKPRLISKKKRELVESENGPKEISPFSFDELMMRGIPKEGVDFFVFPSTTVEIPCFTSDEMKLSPNIADSALYKWSHSNFKAITEGRILEDANHKGSLIIQDVTLSDSDNYTCNVKYIDPDTQVTVKRTFVHAVRVVVLPRLALHTNLHYSASSLCDQELLEMFELYLPQQIERSICSLGTGSGRSLCSVEIHNPVCYTKSKQDSMKRSIDPRLLWRTDFQKSRWIREILNEDVQEMEISLNYELDLKRVPKLVPESSNWSSCSPHCQQKLSLKTVEILRDSFLDALLLPVKTKSVYFQPSLDSINIKLLTACDGGLELKDGFCIPCERHHYSEQGKTVCAPCPPGTFQDDIGAKSCVPCPHPFRSNCFYLGSMKNFTVFVLVVTGGLVAVSCCWCAAVKLRNKAAAKKKDKRKTPEPLPPDFD